MIRLRRGNVPLVGTTSGPSSETTAPPEATILPASVVCARGWTVAWPDPMTATVVPPAWSAAAWAAPSMPTASPDTTHAPTAARFVARRDATALP